MSLQCTHTKITMPTTTKVGHPKSQSMSSMPTCIPSLSPFTNPAVCITWTYFNFPGPCPNSLFIVLNSIKLLFFLQNSLAAKYHLNLLGFFKKKNRRYLSHVLWIFIHFTNRICILVYYVVLPRILLKTLPFIQYVNTLFFKSEKLKLGRD